MDNTEKRGYLKTIIIELSKQINMPTGYCKATLKKLEKVYSDDFRHAYSDITSLLLDMNSQKKIAIQ